ncbi:hypothetical protein K7711_43440 [Nocardia sp. CA2R105]|uniref:nitrilase-related carbon-nitrogen hydrolase n=1 Tax=Nocardia coffeae TaxID=2873381 RepID=UPI001CA5F901|nr:nitrilase-related carbon-nitrogen hydrolase [Nocardia coffeae]MBY8863385.1 hypothetical protein [Nocardia coffeae]
MSSSTFPERLTLRKIKVAGVQAEPVFLDLDGTTNKAIALIEQAGRERVDLIGFPEAYIPTFPNWYETIGEGAKSRGFDKELFKHSVEIPGEHINAIAEACAKANVNAVVGVNERRPGSSGTMWNTQVHITREGAIVGKHQKYVPTSGERLVHKPGTTGCANTFETDFGVVSGLICAENSNPLGMYAAAINYPVVHVASWPYYFHPYFPMHHAIQTATAGLAYSLKTFVVSAVSRIPANYIDEVAETEEQRKFLEGQRALKKGALVLDPVGRVIAHGDGSDDELLVVDIDLEDVLEGKLIVDVAGHSNRPHIFAPLFDSL